MLMTSRTCVQAMLEQQLQKIQQRKELCTQNNRTLFTTYNYTMHMYILHNQGPKTRWKKKLSNINLKNCNPLESTIWTLKSLRVWSLEFKL